MYKKLNNKGYMLIEIIFASVISFSVAYYLLNLTYKFKDLNEDVYMSTAFSNDKILIEKNIMNDLANINIVNISVISTGSTKTVELILEDNSKRKIEINKSSRTINYSKWNGTEYTTYYKKTLNSSLDIGNVTITDTNKNVKIIIPVTSKYSTEKYSIRIYFKYKGEATNQTEPEEPTPPTPNPTDPVTPDPTDPVPPVEQETPQYFAFGTPTTSSTNNYNNIDHNIFAGLYNNGTEKALCLNFNNQLHCFKNNNWNTERNNISQFCTTNNGNSIHNNEIEAGCTIDSGSYELFVYATGVVEILDWAEMQYCELSASGTVDCGYGW